MSDINIFFLNDLINGQNPSVEVPHDTFLKSLEKQEISGQKVYKIL